MSQAIERVLVTLDASAETRTAIATAVRLASRARARLHGVFVEESDLLSLAGLPVARQVIHGRRAAPLTIADMELQLQAAAMRVRDELVVAARTQGLDYSFEILRGDAETALAAASRGDLVVASAVARAIAGHLRIPSRWPEALASAPGPTLLTREEREQTGGILALVRERNAVPARLLRSAAWLAQCSGGRLTAICSSSIGTIGGLEQWIAKEAAEFSGPLAIEVADDPEALPEHLVVSDFDVLAVEASTMKEPRWKEFIRRFSGNLLIVRQVTSG